MPNPHFQYAQKHVTCLKLVERIASLFCAKGLPPLPFDRLPDEFVAALAELKAAGMLCDTRGVRTVDFVGRSPQPPVRMCGYSATTWLQLSEKIIGTSILRPKTLLQGDVTAESARERWDDLKAFFRPFFADFDYGLLIARLQDEGMRAGKNTAAEQEDDHFTVMLSQIAPLVNRQKRTLELWIQQDENFPLPDVEGGGGRAHEWKWSIIRSYLEKKTGRKLPERHPADTSRPDFGALED